MKYSEVCGKGLILAPAKLYTLKHVNKVIKDHPELTYTESVFVVQCSAIFHDTKCAKTVDKFKNSLLGFCS